MKQIISFLAFLACLYLAMDFPSIDERQHVDTENKLPLIQKDLK